MNQIAQLLFERHTHVEMLSHEPDKIVYTEEAVIDILKILGHEGPVWDTNPKSAREQLDEMRAQKLSEDLFNGLNFE